MVFVAPEKVCTPVLAVYVPLLVRFPAILTIAAPFSVIVPPVLIIMSEPNDNVAAAVSVIAPPLLMVTAPVNVLVPVAEEMASVPLVPPPTVVVPVTPRVNAPTVKVIPLSIAILLQVAAALLCNWLGFPPNT